jgi:small-conductance mechanosensitive channel
MENLETFTLEFISQYLERMEQGLTKIKGSLDKMETNLEKMHTEENSFYNLLSKARVIQMKLKGFLGASKVECFEQIDQRLNDICSLYNEKVLEIKSEVKTLQFSVNGLEDYREHITEFFSSETDNLNDIIKKQKAIFENSIKDIEDGLDLLKRLLKSLSRKLEEIETLNDFIITIESAINNIEVPSGLDNLIQLSEEQINNLYIKTIETISTLREKVKRFIIENGLLSENEIATLEILYKMKSEELDFVIVTTELKETLQFPEETLQSILFDLSMKGFITLKIIP